MRLSRKHINQQTVDRHDFTAGINSTLAVEMIGDRQVSECVNMEPDRTTGLLKTVDGSELLLTTAFDIFAGMYDRINNKYLLVSTETENGATVHNVYVSDLTTTTKVGVLSGTQHPVSCLWENGLIVASGGNLQYWNGTTFDTLANSPKSDTAFIRTARVVVGVPTTNELHYSNIGDEASWTEDTSDNSASKYLETGYKDGGRFIGAVNLSDDIVIVKDNGYIYRLTGDYPNWNLKRISHEIDCDGRLSMCGLVNSVAILGAGKIQIIDTTQDYGDMKPTNVASDVTNELQRLQKGANMVYLPTLNQIWIIGTLKEEGCNDGYVIMYDCERGGFFTRRFNNDVVDAFVAVDEVIVVRKNHVTRLKERCFEDMGHLMKWRFRAKRMVSLNEFLLKRVQVNITPFFTGYSVNRIGVGGVNIGLPVPYSVRLIYNNSSPVCANTAPIYDDGSSDRSLYYAVGDKIYGNNNLIYHNAQKVYPTVNISKTVKCIYRNKSIDICGAGCGGNFILNSINFDIAEV